MITVHLDKLHSGNPFVKIWIQLEAEEGILHLFNVLPVTITGCTGCACRAVEGKVTHNPIQAADFMIWKHTHGPLCRTHVTHRLESKNVLLFWTYDVEHVILLKPEYKSRWQYTGEMGDCMQSEADVKQIIQKTYSCNIKEQSKNRYKLIL